MSLNSINPFKKGSKFYSVTRLKCPKYQEGDWFLTRNPYNLRKFDKMPEKCPVCGQLFELEIGFYWGAMYVSYVTTVITSVIIIWFLFTFFDLSALYSII